jgi:hypothetical protein
MSSEDNKKELTDDVTTIFTKPLVFPEDDVENLYGGSDIDKYNQSLFENDFKINEDPEILKQEYYDYIDENYSDIIPDKKSKEQLSELLSEQPTEDAAIFITPSRPNRSSMRYPTSITRNRNLSFRSRRSSSTTPLRSRRRLYTPPIEEQDIPLPMPAIVRSRSAISHTVRQFNSHEIKRIESTDNISEINLYDRTDIVSIIYENDHPFIVNQTFPANLKHLYIRMNRPYEIDPRSFPQTLQTLILSGEHVRLKPIATLPQTLTYLKVEYQHFNPVVLPIGIVHLNIRNYEYKLNAAKTQLILNTKRMQS